MQPSALVKSEGFFHIHKHGQMAEIEAGGLKATVNGGALPQGRSPASYPDSGESP